MNTNFKVIGLTRLGIKPKSTTPEADALTIRPSELLGFDMKFSIKKDYILEYLVILLCPSLNGAVLIPLLLSCSL